MYFNSVSILRSHYISKFQWFRKKFKLKINLVSKLISIHIDFHLSEPGKENFHDHYIMLKCFEHNDAWINSRNLIQTTWDNVRCDSPRRIFALS